MGDIPSHWVHCDGLNPFCPEKLEYAFHPAGFHDPEGCILTNPDKAKKRKSVLSKKDKKIVELEKDIEFLNQENDALNNELIDLGRDYLKVMKENEALRGNRNQAPEIPTTSLYPNPRFVEKLKRLKNRQPKYAGDICIDLWPLRDWFRFSIKTWNPGKYAQVVIGPVRIEFYSA